MLSSRELVEQTVRQDLFGPRGLTEAAEVEAPDKYEILSCLGRGGFGVVYKARDKVLDRPVALKFLTDARPTDLERFRREARFAARLNNPSIVQVYEFGEHEGSPYIAMQFVDGASLAEQTLPQDEMVRAIRAAASALQIAHAEGIVHRDVKPANILMDRQGRAFLTDFGIARDVRGGAAATISQEGALVGTPALMAPEQARGDLHAIDARSDVYALGATLYYLLCGRYPFERTNIVDLLHAVLHDEPPLPRSLNSSIPRTLEAIVLRCMHKERSRRYQSMAEVVRDLDAWLAGRSVEGESAAWFRKKVGAPEPLRADSDPDLFQSVGFEIIRQIADWDANLYRVSKNITRFDHQLDGIIDRLDAILQSHPDVAWARFYRGVALMRLGRLEEALDEMERSIDRLSNQADAQFEMGRLYLTLFLREQHKAQKHFSRVGTRHHLADWRRRLQQAAVCYDEARRLRQGLPPWQIQFADAVRRLADEDFDGCIRACDEILERDGDIEDAWKLRGDALRLSGGDPFDSYDAAIRVRRSFVEAYRAKAEACFDRGRPAEARECLKQALEIRPEAVDLLAQLARSFLLGVRDATSRATAIGPPAASEVAGVSVRSLLDEAHACIERASALDPRNYDVAVTRAELFLEDARYSNDPARIAAALAALEEAKSLDGCQNRVNYLKAATLLERARLLSRGGADPHADLQKVLELASGDPVTVPDNTAWLTLRAAAEAELASRGG